MNVNSYEYLKLLLETSRYGFIAFDNNHQITYINQRVYEMHGIPLHESADNWQEYSTVLEVDGVTPTPLENIPGLRALRGEKVIDAYHILKYKNSHSVLVKYNAEPLYDVTGTQIGGIVTTEDCEDLVSTMARFRAIFEQSPLSIQILDKTGKVLLINNAYKKLWGISDDFANNVILKTYNILEDELLIKSGDIEFILKAFKGEIVNVKPFLYDPTSIGLPGRARWAGGIIYPLKNARGEVQEVVIIHQDMTEQRNAEDGKEKLYFQLEAILRQMPAGIMVADLNGKISLYNSQMMNLIGDPAHAFHTFHKPLMSSLQCEVLNSHEIKLQKIGQFQIVSTSSGPIHDPDGKITASVLIATEITKQKRIESNQNFLTRIKSLLISTIDYDKVLNQLSDAVIPYLADGCIIDVVDGESFKRLITKHIDPEIEELMNEMIKKYPLKSGAPLPSMRAIETGQSQFYREADTSVIASSTYNEDHMNMVLKIGSRSHMTFPLQVRGKVMGAINFIVTKKDRSLFDDIDFELGKNIARHTSLVIDNARLFKDAKSAVELRDDFISMASHELRTPMTSINLQIDVLRSLVDSIESQPEITSIMYKFLESTRNQLNRLTRLVDDMLDISRISTGKLKLAFRTTNIKLIIEDVLARFEEQTKASNIEVKFFCDTDIFCLADGERLDQVITNFMTNAIRYGKKKPIHVYLLENESTITIKVQDFGRGVMKEDQERIFNRFERAHTSEDVSGLGLGLYINKQIVDEHNGNISIESEPGKGATFIVELPRVSQGE